MKKSKFFSAAMALAIVAAFGFFPEASQARSAGDAWADKLMQDVKKVKNFKSAKKIGGGRITWESCKTSAVVEKIETCLKFKRIRGKRECVRMRAVRHVPGEDCRK